MCKFECELFVKQSDNPPAGFHCMNPEWPPDKSSDCHAAMEPIAVVSLNRWWLVSSTFVDGLASSHMREPESVSVSYFQRETALDV